MALLENKKFNFNKLKKYGFKQKGEYYTYSNFIMNGSFVVNIRITKDGSIKTEVAETDTNEIYTLHLVEGVSGSFVGQVKSEYEALLSDITDKCCEMDIFEFEYSKKVLEYSFEKYGSPAEYLWEKFPRNAVCRRQDNNKWFFAVLSVTKDKFGFESKEITEVIDLRVPAQDMEKLLKEPNIYPGYHMNKKHWVSIILDGSMDIEEIYRYIDISYELAKKK